MTKSTFAVGVVVSVIFVSLAHAQEIAGLRMQPAESSAGKPVDIEIELYPAQAGKSNVTACAMVVNFGDGEVRHMVIDPSQPVFKIPYTYKALGSYAVSIEGKMLWRGLSSTFGCFGKSRTIAVSIRDEDLVAREAEERIAQKAALDAAVRDRVEAEAITAKAAQDRATAASEGKRALADRNAAKQAATLRARERAAAEKSAEKATSDRISAERMAAKPVPDGKSVKNLDLPLVKDDSVKAQDKKADKAKTDKPAAKAKSALDL